MTLWCIGRNYRDHAAELNNPVPQKPLIFTKPEGCLSLKQEIRLPDWSGEIHYECELAVQLDVALAPHRLALALDLTARKVQDDLKKKGEPWTLAKGFKQACPMSAAIAFPADFTSLQFEFYKNSQRVQKGEVKDMIFALPELLSYLQNHFPLQAGDWILTGTPAGVGPLSPGDQLKAQIPGKLTAEWRVVGAV